MPRPSYSRETVRTMTLELKNEPEIAKALGCVDSTIGRIWKEMIANGTLTEEEVARCRRRRGKHTPKPKGDGHKALSQTVPSNIIKRLEDVETDIERYRAQRITEAIGKLDILALLDLLKMGEKYPEMAKRAEIAERGYLNMLTNKEARQKEEQRQKDQKLATEVEIRQGRMNPPLRGGKNVEGHLVFEACASHNPFSPLHETRYGNGGSDDITYRVIRPKFSLDKHYSDNITFYLLTKSIEYNITPEISRWQCGLLMS